MAESDPVDFKLDDPRITHCEGCKAPIIFLPTVNKKMAPVDAATVGPDDKEFVWGGKHVNHFVTCPARDKFRRKK